MECRSLWYAKLLLTTLVGLWAYTPDTQLDDDLFEDPYRKLIDADEDTFRKERAINGMFKLNPKLEPGLFTRDAIPVPSFAFNNYTNYDFDYDIWQDEHTHFDGGITQLRHLINDYTKPRRPVDQFEDKDLEYEENVGLALPITKAALLKVKTNCRSFIIIPGVTPFTKGSAANRGSPLGNLSTEPHEPSALDLVTSSAIYPSSALNKHLFSLGNTKPSNNTKVSPLKKMPNATISLKNNQKHNRSASNSSKIAQFLQHIKTRTNPPVKNQTEFISFSVNIKPIQKGDKANKTINVSSANIQKPHLESQSEKIRDLLQVVSAYPTKPSTLNLHHMNAERQGSNSKESIPLKPTVPSALSPPPLPLVRASSAFTPNSFTDLYGSFANPQDKTPVHDNYSKQHFSNSYLQLAENWLAKRGTISRQTHCQEGSIFDEGPLVATRVRQNYCNCGNSETSLRATLSLHSYSNARSSSRGCVRAEISKPAAKPNFPKRLIAWEWKDALKSLEYGSTGQQANVFFMLDGNIKTQFPVVKRLIYNILRLFALERTFFSFTLFSSKIEQHNTLKMFKSPEEALAAVQALKSVAASQRKLGETVGKLGKDMDAIRKSQPNIKMVLFLFVNGPSDGCFHALSEAGELLRTLNIKTYVLAFGSKPVPEQLVLLTTPRRVFRVAFYEHFINGNKDMPPILLRLQNAIQAYLGGPKKAKEKNVWFYRSWNWYKNLKEITYGSVGSANVAFLFDSTNEALVPFGQKLIYNYIRLFQLQLSYFTILCYGDKISRVLPWRSFGSPQEIQQAMLSIGQLNGPRLAAPAAQELLLSFVEKNKKETLPSILFLITTGKLADVKELEQIATKLHKMQIQIYVIAIDVAARTYRDDFNQIVSITDNIFYGTKRWIISGQSFKRLTSLLIGVSGKGAALRNYIGNSFTAKLQQYWNWDSKLKEFDYGVVNRANVVIMVDSYFPDNYEALHHLVYNIMKLFTLSGTYFSLIAYEGRVVQMSNFQQFSSNAEIMKICSLIPTAKKSAHKTGNALAYAFKAFGQAPPGNPNILITLLTGKSAGDVIRPAAELRKYGVVAIAIGLGNEVDRRELALISFSSAFMLHAAIDALPRVVRPLRDSLIKVCGSVTASTGVGGRLVVTDVDIIKNWEWKAFNYGIHYHSVKAKPVAFVIDGSNKLHFDVIRKFAYNVAKLFNIGTSFLTVAYGGDVNPIATKPLTFLDDTALQIFFQSISYSGDLFTKMRNRVGYALTYILSKWRHSDPKDIKVLFLIATAKPAGDIASVIRKLRSAGVRVFIITIGDVPDIGSKVANHYLEAQKWKSLPIAVSKLRHILGKVAGRLTVVKEIGFQEVSPIDQVAFKPTMPPPTPLHMTSTASKPLPTIKMSWNWPAIFNGIRYGSLKGSNVIICLEGSKKDNLDVLAGFAFNFLRLFDIDSTLATVVSYSLTPRLLNINKPLTSLKAIFLTLRHLLLRPGRKVNLGDTLNFLETDVLPKVPQKRRNKKTIILIISRTAASDFFHDAVERIKGAGHTLAMLGVEGASFGEITTVASTGQLGAYSYISMLPAILLRFQYALTMIVNGLSGTRQLSTINIGIGAKLVGQTITTGSVPQENAGTSGTHDSGSPFSKPNLPPRNPNLPNAEVVPEGGKGGATGIGPAATGGTDIAAGGIIAGLVNQKQEGTVTSKKSPLVSSSSNIATYTDQQPSPAQAIARGTFISPTSFGDKVLHLGGVKLDENQGINSAGGIITKDVERSGEAVGPVTEISLAHVKGGVQYMKLRETLLRTMEERWNWPRVITSFAYETLAPASVNILLDVEDISHFGILLGFTYNIMRLFAIQGTTYSVLTQGKAPVNVLAQDREVVCPSEIRKMLLSIDHAPASFSITANLGWIMRDTEVNRSKKKVLFLIIRSHLVHIDEVKGTINQLRRHGVLVYIIALGKIGKDFHYDKLMPLVHNDLNFLHQCTVEESPLLVTTLQYSLLKELGPGSSLGSFLSVQTGLEKLRNPLSPYKSKPAQGLILKLEMTSRGCNRVNCRDSIASIKINGVEQSPNKPGINIVVLDFPSGDVQVAKSFDTTANESASTGVESTIYLVKGSRVILVAAKGNYTARIQEKALQALIGIGAVNLLKSNPRGSYVLVASKGLPTLTWTQQEQKKEGTAKIFAQMMFKYEDESNQGAIELPDASTTVDSVEGGHREVNVAKGRPTSQSSTAFGAFSRRAVDGDKSNRLENKSCSQTKVEDDPWWMVDLEQDSFVHKIEMTNQDGAGWDRMKNVEIRVGMEKDAEDIRNKICREKVTFDKGETKSIYCPHPIRGRYVIIRIPGADKILTLCEVRVFIKQCDCKVVKKTSYGVRFFTRQYEKQKRRCKCREPMSLEDLLLHNRTAPEVTFDDEVISYMKMQQKRLVAVYDRMKTLHGRKHLPVNDTDVLKREQITYSFEESAQCDPEI